MNNGARVLSTGGSVALSALIGTILSLALGLTAWWAGVRSGQDFPGFHLAAYGAGGGVIGSLAARAVMSAFSRMSRRPSLLGEFLIGVSTSLSFSTLGGLITLSVLRGQPNKFQIAVAVMGSVIGIFAGGMSTALHRLITASER